MRFDTAGALMFAAVSSIVELYAAAFDYARSYVDCCKFSDVGRDFSLFMLSHGRRRVEVTGFHIFIIYNLLCVAYCLRY